MNILHRLKEKAIRFLHNEQLKQRIYSIVFKSDTPEGRVFDKLLTVYILFSVLLVFLESLRGLPDFLSVPFITLEYLLTAFFTAEYLARLYCSPRRRKYALSFFGIIDLLATLPFYLGLLFPGSRYLIILRTFRLIRVLRIFRLFTLLREGERLFNAIKASSTKIFVFFLFVLILVTSLGTLMYMAEHREPGTGFTDIPTSIYWAIVTMTTVGYGDITPVTAFGKFFSAFVMLLGYTIIAVPTGIVSASFIKGNAPKSEKECPGCGCDKHDSRARFCRYCGHRLTSAPETPEPLPEKEPD